MTGTPQQRYTGQAYGAFQVEVTDSFGNPVAGATVDFRTPAQGPSGSFGASGATDIKVTTDQDGLARPGELTANEDVGSFTMTAALAGGLKTEFQLTNTARPGAGSNDP